jgi:hypothetical protein
VSLKIACNNGVQDCPEVPVASCTATLNTIPTTTTAAVSITTTLTNRVTSTMNTTVTQTSLVSVCLTPTPVPSLCSGCDPLTGQNMCDETTTCTGLQKQCACRRGYKYENVAGSQNQWRLGFGGPVFVRVGLHCTVRK